MSIFRKTFVILHGKIKKYKDLSVMTTYHINLKGHHWMLNLKKRHWALIALLVVVTLTRTIPGWGYFYTLYIYPLIGTVLSPISGVFPFAIGDIFIACSIAWCILYPIWKRKKAALGRVVEYLLWVYAWFYLAWGLNYSQPNIYYRIGMKPAEVSEAKFKEFAYRYADSLNSLSEERGVKSILSEGRRVKSEKFNNNAGVGEELKEETAEEILKGYKELNTDINLRNKNLDRDSKSANCKSTAEGKVKSARDKNPYIGINPPFNNHPHVKTMVFSRLSSMAGVTGSMGPFFCEFTLNGEVRPHDYPSTYAHEFAHFLGVANEGEANFYSYIVCASSQDKAVKFSGYYHIFFHVLANVFDILGEKEGEKYLKHIRPEIIQLARSDRKYWLDKRCKALDDAQDFIFDLYLRGNHVAEGRKSYSGVIGLIFAWEEYQANVASR